jgi:hypothetical protein
MNRFGFFFSLVMLWTLSGSWLSAQTDYEVIEHHELGSVNWSRRVTDARGYGAPVEQTLPSDVNKQERLTQLAQSKAHENLMAIILSIPLDSERLASTVIFSQNDIMNQIRTMIGQSKILKKEYMTDGSVEVVHELSFDGGFAQLLLPEEIQQIQPLKTVREKLPGVKKSLEASGQINPEIPVPYTGLIVNTRGLTVRPVLSPKVLDESGQEVYGPAFISREYAVQHGTVYYSRSLKDPAIAGRTGDHPLIVTGLKTQGTRQSDVLISSADASLLHSNSAHLEFLSQCRVVIIIDKQVQN